MVGNKIHDQLQALLMRRVQQSIEVIKRAKERIYTAVVAYIVTEVFHRRLVDRGQPDRSYAQPLQVVEPLGNTFKVAYTVAIAVHERPDIHFINYPFLP